MDLIVVGTSRAAVSLALEAAESGVENVVLVDDGSAPLHLPPEAQEVVTVVTGGVGRIEPAGDVVTMEVGDSETRARVAAVVENELGAPKPKLEIPADLADRVHLDSVPEVGVGRHVLVVGGSEQAAEVAVDMADRGAAVVLARGNVSPNHLSRLTRSALLLKEAERRLTVFWHSRPVTLDRMDGEPMVGLDDVNTPDLVFEDVVVVDDFDHQPKEQEGPIWRVGDGHLPPGKAWSRIRSRSFPDLEVDSVPVAAVPATEQRIEELREAHYNSTITRFERTHSDLWLIRVKPDNGEVSYRAGQYASLGLGYWEPRVDGARDSGLERKWEKLVRRSYSISSPIFDEDGYLHDPARADSLEFYIVLVPPSNGHVPGLTPRLALCDVGDRIYMGPRIVGRYTLAPVHDPSATVVFLATGTGEAPHNAMATELLRKGHHGPIVSVVSVRYRADLAYLETQRRLEERFPNYHYLPLPTREPDTEKLYVQDAIRREMLQERFGVALDPENTHIFLCGNPAMIGIPQWENDEPVFPDTVGACQLLNERGFDIDRHGHLGNVHTEKYW